MADTDALFDLRNALSTGGLSAGMDMLNKRVLHRYTVAYRFDGDAFYAVCAIDKLGESTPELFHRVPFEDSFCQFSVGIGEFRTGDSMDDSRLEGHVHRATVQSYVGLPVSKPQGGLFGTFCHLDVVPQRISDSEFEFLQRAVPLLSPYLEAAADLRDVMRSSLPTRV